MNKIKTICKISLVLIVLILLLVSSAALAAIENDTGNVIIADNSISSATLTATEKSPSPKITETRITTSGSACNPAIYGDKIVWEDRRDGHDNSNIYMYDLSTKKETQITTSGSARSPNIYGNRIMWLDDRSNDYNVYMYDLSTKKETQISTDGSVPHYSDSVGIYGDKIVWQEGMSSNKICIYDLSTNKTTEIVLERLYPDSNLRPDIYGNKIVWEDTRNGYGDITNPNIYMYDLSTKKETRITTSESAQYPSIYGDRIVCIDRDENDISNDDIYMYDLSTKNGTRISTSGEVWGYPDIYGNRIVWNDGRNGGYSNDDIYMYDLSTKKEIQVTTNKSRQNNPAIYSDKIVWEDYRNNQSGGSIEKQDIYMGTISSEEPKLPVAIFSASPTSGKTPLTVKFTDQSTGTPTKWGWSFGDGATSSKQNPVHKYSKAGTYTVNLTVKNNKGSNTVTKTEYIKIITKPVANFTSSVTSGKAPLNVKFIDTSTGTPAAWIWEFGDGITSTQQNPTHKYSKAGTYSVNLTVKNAAGRNTVTKIDYITVTTASQTPTADFWGWPLSGKAPLKVTFTETSKGSPTSWKWDFGDGTYSTQKSPVHTYSAAGTYTVKLTATNAAGSSTKTKWNYIKVSGTSQAPVAAFLASPTSGKAPLKVQFTDKSTNSPTSWKWSFGDKTYSTAKNPAHTYNKAGKYTVSLTVKNDKGSNTKTISEYIIAKK